MQLTLQLHLAGYWHDAMRIDVDKPEAGLDSSCSFAYEQAFLVDHLNALARPTSPSVSARVPLGWDLFRTAGLPAFLHDIIPAGAARRFSFKQWGLL
jgi:serine/threonine-protein kinase HipA